MTVELDGIDTRIMRLTPWSSDYSDAIVSADGETLYYLADSGDGPDLWSLPLRDGDPSLAAHIGSGGISLQATKDGKNIFVMGRKMSKLDKGDKLKAITVDARHDIDPAAEREAMFDFMAAEEGARFYDTGMHGVDWPMMTAAYRRFLPHINNNYDSPRCSAKSSESSMCRIPADAIAAHRPPTPTAQRRSVSFTTWHIPATDSRSTRLSPRPV